MGLIRLLLVTLFGGLPNRAQYITLVYNKLINSNALTPPNGLYLSFQNGNYIGSYNSCKEALESLHIKDIKNY